MREARAGGNGVPDAAAGAGDRNNGDGRKKVEGKLEQVSRAMSTRIQAH